jgi:hypothetical protein
LRVGYAAHLLTANLAVILYGSVLVVGVASDRIEARILMDYPFGVMLLQWWCTGSWVLTATRSNQDDPGEPPPGAKGKQLVQPTIHLALLFIVGVATGVAHAPVFASIMTVGFVLAWLILPDTLRHLRHHLDAGLSPRSRDGRGTLYVLAGGFQLLAALAVLAAFLQPGPGPWAAGRYLVLGLLSAGLGVVFVSRRRWTPFVLAEYVPLGLGLGLYAGELLRHGETTMPRLELMYVACHVVAAGLLVRELYWVSRRMGARY